MNIHRTPGEGSSSNGRKKNGSASQRNEFFIRDVIAGESGYKMGMLRRAVSGVLLGDEAERKRAFAEIGASARQLGTAAMHRKPIDQGLADEVILALKLSAVEFPNETLRFLAFIADSDQSYGKGTLIEKLDRAIVEAGEVAEAIRGKDIALLETYFEKPGWEAAATKGLLLAEAKSESFNRILARKGLSEDAARLAIRGLDFNEDHVALVNAIRTAIGQSHPMLDVMTDESAKVVKVRIPEGGFAYGPVRWDAGQIVTLQELTEIQGKHVTPEAIIYFLTSPLTRQVKTQSEGINAAISDMKMHLLWSSRGRAPDEVISEIIRGIEAIPPESQREIIRAVKIASSFSDEPLAQFVELIKAMPRDGPLSGMIEAARAEISEFARRVHAKDAEWLEKQAVERTDFEFGAVLDLVSARKYGERLIRILGLHDVEETTARAAAAGIVMSNDIDLMILAVSNAKEQRHPHLGAIVEEFAGRTALARVTGQDQQAVDTKTVITVRIKQSMLGDMYPDGISVSQLLGALEKIREMERKGNAPYN